MGMKCSFISAQELPVFDGPVSLVRDASAAMANSPVASFSFGQAAVAPMHNASVGHAPAKRRCP